MWTPSVGTRCGVAQYADALVTAMHRLGLPVTHTAEPDESDAAVLHLQHEHSLVAPSGSATPPAARGSPASRSSSPSTACAGRRTTGRARSRRWSRTPPTEVALLSDRRPGRRVELIPHGCPTWFPRRKVRRGRVVATFGFLEPHKGLPALLEAAAAVGDVEAPADRIHARERGRTSGSRGCACR